MTRNKPAPDFDIFQKNVRQPTEELVPGPPPPPSEGSEATDEGGENCGRLDAYPR